MVHAQRATSYASRTALLIRPRLVTSKPWAQAHPRTSTSGAGTVWRRRPRHCTAVTTPSHSTPIANLGKPCSSPRRLSWLGSARDASTPWCSTGTSSAVGCGRPPATEARTSGAAGSRPRSSVSRSARQVLPRSRSSSGAFRLSRNLLRSRIADDEATVARGTEEEGAALVALAPILDEEHGRVEGAGGQVHPLTVAKIGGFRRPATV